MADVPFDFTTEPDDLARASWWVMEVSGGVLDKPETAQQLLMTCPLEELPEAAVPDDLAGGRNLALNVVRLAVRTNDTVTGLK